VEYIREVYVVYFSRVYIAVSYKTNLTMQSRSSEPEWASTCWDTFTLCIECNTPPVRGWHPILYNLLYSTNGICWQNVYRYFQCTYLHIIYFVASFISTSLS